MELVSLKAQLEITLECLKVKLGYLQELRRFKLILLDHSRAIVLDN